MDPINSNEIAETTLLERVDVARSLVSLNEEQWQKLGLFQSLHRTIMRTYFQLTYLNEDQVVERCQKEELINTVKSTLEAQVKTLFSLTAVELIEELHSADWLTHTQGTIEIPEKRWTQFKDQVLYTTSGDLEIRPIRPILSESERKAEVTKQREEAQVAKRAERLRKSLEYIDPLQHISVANETPFTIRRLDQILTSLDGIVLRQDSFRDLLKMEEAEYTLVFDATDRLGLTHQSDDGYIRLDFHGTSIARQPRAKRLKTLSMIASRLRREAKLNSES